MQRYVTLIWLSLYLLSTMTLAGCGEFNISDAGMFDDVNDLQARVAQGEDINFQDMYGDTPLINSVFFGNLENVQYLLENGANVQLKNYDGNNSILVWPILDKDDDEAILKLLLQYGANINEKDSANETPLHIAILFGRNKHVSMLVDNGVDVNVKGVNGMTPVAYVMESKVSENSISSYKNLLMEVLTLTLRILKIKNLLWMTLFIMVNLSLLEFFLKTVQIQISETASERHLFLKFVS